MIAVELYSSEQTYAEIMEEITKLQQRYKTGVLSKEEKWKTSMPWRPWRDRGTSVKTWSRFLSLKRHWEVERLEIV